MNAVRLMAKRPMDYYTRLDKIWLGILGWVFPILVKLLHLTLRYQYINVDNLQKSKEQTSSFAIALWHQNSLASILAHPKEPVSVLVSPDLWGSQLDRVIRRLQLSTIRGWKSRKRSISLPDKDHDRLQGKALAVTVDGPFGPKHEVKAGVVSYSLKQGVPILPFAAVADRYWELATWDKQRIPKPFSKVRVIYGAPIDSFDGNSISDFEKTKIKLSQSLHKLERQAARFRIY